MNELVEMKLPRKALGQELDRDSLVVRRLELLTLVLLVMLLQRQWEFPDVT
jgi:hypothetical protein